MSASDFSGRLLAPVMALPRRPLSSSESTASCSMRFSLRTMMSGAFSSSRRFNRLLRLITRRYRSFRSDVAKRPPSSGTSGRSSGGSTGSTSRIIHSGLMPDFWNASSTFRRLAIFLILVSEPVASSSLRSFSISEFTSSDFSSSRMPSASHARREVVGVLLDLRQVIVFRQQLAAIERRHAGFGDDVGFEVQHAFDVAQGHVEHHAHTRGQALQEPDVRHGRREFDMAHALAAHLGQRHFNAALLADHAAMLQALVLAAQALVILDRPENLGAKEAIALGLERTIVDRFRLLHFAVRPGTDLLGRGEARLDRVEFFFLRNLLE